MSEFTNYLEEIFEPFGAVTIKRMFGGYGVFYHNLMFGLIADDVLYLKVDKETDVLFAERGLEKFEYIKNGKAMKMSYRLAPEEMYESPAEAKKWASCAYNAALRSKK